MTTTTRTVDSTPTVGAGHLITCIGDSIMQAPSLGKRYDQMWPCYLEGLLQAAGCRVGVCNFGKSGDTSGPWDGYPSIANTISRFGAMTQYGVPALGIIAVGVNDPGLGIPAIVTPQTVTAYSTTPGTPYTGQVTVADGTAFKVNQSLICGSGATMGFGTITTIAGNVLTVTPAFAFPPTVGTTTVTSGTQPNIQYMVQQLLNAGCPKIMVLSTHLINGNDVFTGTPGAYSIVPNSTYQTIRGYQYAAVQAMANANVVYGDLYNATAALIAGEASFTSGGTIPVTWSSTAPNPLGSATNILPFGGIPYTLTPNGDTVPPQNVNGSPWYGYSAFGRQVNTYTVLNGGTNYQVNDVVSVSGGTAAGGPTATVTAAPGGVISATGLSIAGGWNFSVNDTLTLGNLHSGTAASVRVNTLVPNQHSNPLGDWNIAQCVYSQIAAQTGWLAALQV